MKNMMTAGIALVLIAGSAQAATVTWLGNGTSQTDWSQGANWSTGVEPTAGTGTSGDELRFNGASNYAIYDGSYDALESGGNIAGASYYKQIRIGLSGAGRLDVTGGSLIGDDSGTTHIVGEGSGNSGMLNVSGGYFRTGASTSYIGNKTGGSGTVNVTDGSYVWGRDSSGISGYIGNNGGSGTITVSGSGSFTTRGGIVLGGGTTPGTGMLSVQGGAATIGIGSYNTVSGSWTQNSGSTLQAMVGADGLLSKILIDDTTTNATGGCFATFNSGSKLDLGFLSGSTAGTWTLMEVQNGAITDNGLAFAAGVDTSHWSFNVDNSGANGLLTVTYAIPEPATFGLIGMVGIGLIAVRRFRM